MHLKTLGAGVALNIAILAPALGAETAFASPETAPCPTEVQAMWQVSPTCLDAAQIALRGYGFSDENLPRAIKAFQIEAGVTDLSHAGFGKLGPRTYGAIMTGNGISTIEAQAEVKNGIVVDKSDQTLKFFKNGKLLAGDLISTGKSTATENRETRVGKHRISRIKKGWVVSSLQAPGADPAMGDPNYFDGGEAIHSTPKAQEVKLGHPASHGCVRTAENFQKFLIKKGMGVGTLVVVQE